ncbi:hypothetical protein [Algoriphagus aquimarinus]|uniref:DUF4221 domain-containing protein n=1 Tax=Algoriphagus aquimarinus TaxID=237018 RepID=A0A5C7AIW0_9BACT|nr:hypothetical protein [Algoriphagus aquimarinus]TXE05752.1 hypothetical protein ESV85_17615 [Algoriphagus aquimarinus]
MNKSHFLILTAFFATILFSCSEKKAESTETDPFNELQFEVYDSIMVNVLENVTILDYQEKLDQYLMKEQRGDKVLLVNGKGELLKEVALAGEGPNQIPMIWEGRFFGSDRLIFKEMSATMDFHVFDRDFQKIEKIKGPAVGLNAIFISFFRQTFTTWTEGGEDYILGEEVNSYNPGDVDPEKIGGDFYNEVKTGFLYNSSQDSIKYLSLYSEDWVPRKTNRWIGQSFPFLSFDPKRKKAAVLPPIGDQLFVYDFDGNSLINEKAVALSHPDRDQEIPDPARENQLYPSFSDVKTFGEYQLAIFYTAIPEDVFMEYRSKGEDYYQDPEWRKAQAKYRTPRYIVVKGDQQIGILNELPVAGVVNLGLPDGTLIVKAADGEVERDYNLFYKVRLVEE